MCNLGQTLTGRSWRAATVTAMPRWGRDNDETFEAGFFALAVMIERLDAKLDDLAGRIHHLIRMERQEMSDLSTLQTAVEADTAVDKSAITLINGLAEQLRAAANDPAAIQALADQLSANAADLGAAVAANTPAAPVDPPPAP